MNTYSAEASDKLHIPTVHFNLPGSLDISAKTSQNLVIPVRNDSGEEVKNVPYTVRIGEAVAVPQGFTSKGRKTQIKGKIDSIPVGATYEIVIPVKKHSSYLRGLQKKGVTNIVIEPVVGRGSMRSLLIGKSRIIALSSMESVHTPDETSELIYSFPQNYKVSGNITRDSGRVSASYFDTQRSREAFVLTHPERGSTASAARDVMIEREKYFDELLTVTRGAQLSEERYIWKEGAVRIKTMTWSGSSPMIRVYNENTDWTKRFEILIATGNNLVFATDSTSAAVELAKELLASLVRH